MAIALVQSSAAIGASAVTLPVASTAGNLLVFHGCNGNSPTGAGWALAVDAGGGSPAGSYYYANNPGGISSVAVNGSTLGAYLTEWSGVATSSPLDTTGSNNSAASPLTATTGANVANANSLAVGAIFETESKAGTTTVGAGSGWTLQANNGSTSQTSHFGATYQLNPTSGTTLSEAATSSSMNLSTMSVAIAVFKPAGSSTPLTKTCSDDLNAVF